MITYEIYDKHYSDFREYSSVRKSARAVIVDGKNLFVEETCDPKIIMLPGGKTEEGEDAFDCVKRECEEECGLLIKPVSQLFAIKEYFNDTVFYSVYIECEIIGKCQKELTAHEKYLGLESGWDDIENVKRKIEELILSYPEGSELKCMHKREYIAINHMIEHCSNIK